MSVEDSLNIASGQVNNEYTTQGSMLYVLRKELGDIACTRNQCAHVCLSREGTNRTYRSTGSGEDAGKPHHNYEQVQHGQAHAAVYHQRLEVLNLISLPLYQRARLAWT